MSPRAASLKEHQAPKKPQAMGRGFFLGGRKGFLARRILNRKPLLGAPRPACTRERLSQFPQAAFGVAKSSSVKVDTANTVDGETAASTRPVNEWIYQLKTTLTKIKPPIWRRIQVSGNVTLYKLHRIIQVGECIIWEPRYTLIPAIARNLMDIEAARAVVEHISMPPGVEAEYRVRDDFLSPTEFSFLAHLPAFH